MKKLIFLWVLVVSGGVVKGQPFPALDTLRYGAAYYYEYMPKERLDEDVQLMKEAGINTVRIAESTWGVWEPRDGVFDWTELDRVLDAMEHGGIGVIIGTPTYAIPVWLAREHPEVLVMTNAGRRLYGARQNMDIVSPVFRRYAERIIRQLVTHVRGRRCVIGYQVDNETKSYGNMGAPMQALFVQWLRQRFGTPAAMTRAYGLNYWSNSIHDWADMPSITGNINASLGCAYAAFQRKMVTDYLAWQVRIIRTLKRPDQFITHNFDLEWRASSYGIQPDVDHFAAARAMDVAGIDIYHPTEDRLTGSEIAFGGDLARSMRRSNYLVMETQAQSLAGRQELPYPGQLRLQAFSHLASGADMVEYWPWQSLPNAVETYWKGVLSHDGEPNPLYEEVRRTGKAFRLIGSHLLHLQKHNKAAIFFSNESLTALGWFPFSDSLNYNDILRREYDALYSMNIECDMVNTSSTNLADYSLIVVPPLYSVSDSVLTVLNNYVRNGGHIVYSCKSGFTDENVQVRSTRMPGPLREPAGVSYQLFTNIDHLPLLGDPFGLGPAGNEVHDWAELLVPETATVLARYDDPHWGGYAAITHHEYGKGSITYMGTIPSAEVLRKVLASAVEEAGIRTADQGLSFPLIVRSGVNRYGRELHYYFNYSGEGRSFVYPHARAVELLSGKRVETGETVAMEPWGLVVIEEGGTATGAGGGEATTGVVASGGGATVVGESGGGEGAAGVGPGRDWLDTDGHSIDAHGAGVLFHDGVYYLFGEIKKGRTRLVPGQNWEDYRVNAGGVSCYSSRDLVHWTYKGIALAPDSTDTASDLHISKVIERPKVIYNETTRQFVMWMHIDKNDYGYARAGVAVSDRPQGPYRYLGSVRPNGQMSRDMTVFRDDDGRAYLVYASENNNTMQVCLLSKDYLSPTPVYQRILIGQRREAPAVFKSGGKYYLITSLCSGWDPNPAKVAVADSMMGRWEQEGNPCVGKDSATTFSSQSTYVLPLSEGTFLFMADRWNKTDLEHSGYLWLPFRVEDGRMEIRDKEGGEQLSMQAQTDTGLGSRAQQADSQRVVIGPLSLISYDVKLKSGYSFLRCYDSANHLLLEYQSKGGNYTETPPGTAYVVIGATGGASDWKIEPNTGEMGVKHAPLCNLRQYLQPFWLSDTVYNETVLLYSTAGGAAEGRCMYRPDKILSVRNFSLDTVYHQGTDYLLDDRTLTRMPGSRMPSRADTSFDTKKDLAWYNLQSQWVVVTYTHHDKWDGPTPSYQGDRLPRLMQLLHSGRPVSVVAYGMSITRGMDVSGYDRVAPYMPTYMELFAQGLKRRYPHSPVTLHNAGLPGSTVAWGAQYAEYYIPPLHPDLVMIDFGMNDFWRMSPAEFGDSIRTILRKVRLADPEAEVLLLANMMFDPAYVLDSDSAKDFYTGNLAGYAGELRKLEGKGVVMLDMTDISKAIYQRKKAKDCIVNPLHPNDFMARWYAQGMLATMGPPDR